MIKINNLDDVFRVRNVVVSVQSTFCFSASPLTPVVTQLSLREFVLMGLRLTLIEKTGRVKTIAEEIKSG